MGIISTSSSLITILSAAIKPFKQKVLRQDIYFVLSTEALHNEKDKFLLGDEHGVKYWKPIGGVARSKKVMEIVEKKFIISNSEKKQRSLAKNELAFVIKGYKTRFDKIFEYLGFKNRLKTMKRIIKKHLDESLIVNDLVRETKEEFKIKTITKEDFHKDVHWTCETKKYNTGILRFHLYNVLSLKDSGAKKLIKHKNIEMLKINMRNDKYTISDLSEIFNNLTNK